MRLNRSTGDEGNRNALNLATIEFGGDKFKTGNVDGSGGHPLQSKSNKESRPSPELAIKCPALNCDASEIIVKVIKCQRSYSDNYKCLTIWLIHINPKFQFITKFHFRYLFYVSSHFQNSHLSDLICRTN